MLACILLFSDLHLQSVQAWRSRVTPRIKFAVVSTIMLAALALLSVWNTVGNQVLVVKRNFYGVLSVQRRIDSHSGDILRDILHGRIIHGSQWERTDQQMQPTSYYTSHSGVAMALTRHEPERPRRIGVVGLGAGTLATYGKQGDNIRFYEINPDVIVLAREQFSFLKNSRATTELILGDARLMLEREAPQEFDVLVLDAFSGDAIPVHLLTQEAMQQYDRHLRPDGVLAFHISNLHFDLQPIIAGLATAFSYQSAAVLGKEQHGQAAFKSLWVLLAKEPTTIAVLLDETNTDVPRGQPVLWTDDRNNLFEALR